MLCENFLKLCKIYYYNHCAFFNVQKDFVVQAGDPTDSGEGGSSVWYHIQEQERQSQSQSRSASSGSVSRLFKPERNPKNKHIELGTLSMACSSDGGAGSIFFVTLTSNASYLDGKHAPFGRVVEDDSLDTLRKFNDEVLTDDSGKPLRDVRIRHVVVLDDPFPDPPGLVVPPSSPLPTAAQLKSLRVGEDEELPAEGDADAAELDAVRRAREARAQALTLEMVGDLPFADVKPPENVLFVCKLNAVTRSEDLELIFSRFGEILSCEVIRDKKSGDSLNFAFVEFDKKEDAERAYAKMDNVLIDDRRIHVDFSQSACLSSVPDNPSDTPHMLMLPRVSCTCAGVSKLHNDWIYQRTGGRPPPNKGGSGGPQRGPPRQDRDRELSEPSSRASFRPRNGKGNEEMLFDLGDVSRERDSARDRRSDGKDGKWADRDAGRRREDVAGSRRDRSRSRSRDRGEQSRRRDRGDHRARERDSDRDSQRRRDSDRERRR